MADSSGKWRRQYELAEQERDPVKKREFCFEARRLIQDELLKLGSAKKNGHIRENLERALRKLWALENDPASSKRPS
jgi:hypothetical protein